MAAKPPPKRETFRHGNLPEALIDAALARLEAEGIEAISLRDLARDAGSTTARCTGISRTSWHCWRWSPSAAGNNLHSV